MQYLLEILKLIEGGLNSDRQKVAAYAEHLAQKLEADGDVRASERLRQALDPSKVRSVSLNRLAPQQGRVPLDPESRLTLAEEERPAPMDAEVFLATEPDAVVAAFIRYVRAADRLIAQGVGISPSLIAHGPPGCGKSQLARHIAAELSLPLLTARMDGLVSSYLGSTAKNLRQLFEYAMSRPCVLFLDDFDAVAKMRDDRHELGELKRVVVSLLQNIDSLDRQTVLLAATNHSHLLDPAIWRRFAYTVQINLPNERIREHLFTRFLGTFAGPADTRLLAQVSDGLSGAIIRQVADDAKRQAVLSEAQLASVSGMLRSIVEIRLGAAKENAQLSTRLHQVRRLAPDLFTYRRLAEMFSVSLGQVGHLMKVEDENGRETTSTDQGRHPAPGRHRAAGRSRRKKENLRRRNT